MDSWEMVELAALPGVLLVDVNERDAVVGRVVPGGTATDASNCSTRPVGARVGPPA